MYELLLEYSAHVRVIPARGPGNPYMEALFQHEIPELQEYAPYVRLAAPRVQEYVPYVRLTPRACWNTAPMYDPPPARAGIRGRCAARLPQVGEYCPYVRPAAPRVQE